MRPPIIICGAISADSFEGYAQNRQFLDNIAHELFKKGWSPINFGSMFHGWESEPHEDMMDITTSIISTLGGFGIPVAFAENWPFSKGACMEWELCENEGITHWESKEVPDAGEWNHIDVSGELKKIIRQQNAKGLVKYGERLKVNNGRDPKLDALEEAVDLCHYLTQTVLALTEN